MKELFALNIGGTPIDVPQEIKNLPAPSAFGGNYIGSFIFFLFFAAIIMALFFIVLGGFKWIMSQGDPKEVTAARETITYAAVGLVVIFLSFFFINVIAHFLNIPILGK